MTGLFLCIVAYVVLVVLMRYCIDTIADPFWGRTTRIWGWIGLILCVFLIVLNTGALYISLGGTVS